MVAMVKAGVELAFETMIDVGMKAESAYYESLHETPLIANLISRKKLYEMNKVISRHGRVRLLPVQPRRRPLLREFMLKVETDVIGKGLELKDTAVSNRELVRVDAEIRNHPVEQIGTVLRAYMTAMKPVI